MGPPQVVDLNAGPVSSCEAQAHSTTSFDNTLRDAPKGKDQDIFHNTFPRPVYRDSVQSFIMRAHPNVTFVTVVVGMYLLVCRRHNCHHTHPSPIARRSAVVPVKPRSSTISSKTEALHRRAVDRSGHLHNFFHDLWYGESRYPRLWMTQLEDQRDIPLHCYSSAQQCAHQDTTVLFKAARTLHDVSPEAGLCPEQTGVKYP